jgi:hypothetical protein
LFSFDYASLLGGHTEHLLFMGTTKFPDENGYDKYLSAAGGHSVRPSIFCSSATSETGDRLLC